MNAHSQPALLSPRRGLSCGEAATYIGLGQTKFLALVGEGKMPKPVRIDRRAIWDIRDLDRAFDAMREDQTESTTNDGVDDGVDDGWGDDTP